MLDRVLGNFVQLLALTSLSLAEFEALLVHFELVLAEYLKKLNWRGQPRSRKQSCGTTTKFLPSPAEKLLFILFQVKVHPIQQALAAAFGMRQPQAHRLIHKLLPILLEAEARMGVLPTRIGSEVAEHPFTLESARQFRLVEPIADASGPGESPSRDIQPNAQPLVSVTSTLISTGNDEPSPSVDVLPAKLNSKPAQEVAQVPEQLLLAISPIYFKSGFPTTNGARPSGELKLSSAIQLVLEFGVLMDGFGAKLGIDGTDRRLERPRESGSQEAHYSGKQKTHTIKNTIVANLVTLKIVFLGETASGSRHDKKLADLDDIVYPAGSDLWKDTGYQAYEPSGPRNHQPKKKPIKRELTENEKQRNRLISRVRVRVEHAICGVKRLRILKDEFRMKKPKCGDVVMLIGCGLHNLRRDFRCKHLAR